MKRLYPLLLALISGISGMAQDQQFTQFYAVPGNVNPALAGASIQSRLALQYRNQWSAIPGAYQAFNMAYDQYIPGMKSGIGFLINHDRAGTGALRTTGLNFQYAYEARISRNWFFRPAMQFGYVSKDIDFNKLTFYDQMIREGEEATLEIPTGGPVNYFDFGAGIITYGKNFWLGATMFHVNQPNESLFASNESHLPRRLSVHGGLRLRVKGNSLTKLDHHIVIASNYQTQGEFDEMDLGMYYEFSPVVIGMWYRGLPLKKNGYDQPNHDAVAILLGVQASRYKFGYSYDITISSLGISSSAGSHEISLVYQWASKHNVRSRKPRITPCAKF